MFTSKSAQIIVQKFGGNSLVLPERRGWAVDHVLRGVSSGCCMVVVVSAIGRQGDPYATDTLLQLVNHSLDERTTDLLMTCGEVIVACFLSSLLNQRGITNRVFTGAQAGILTDDTYTKARVKDVKPMRVKQALDRGEVAIVTGFQGATSEYDVTTLGRGGSDTTAALLGAALKADLIEIFTDVQGVMTADPTIVENAALLPHIAYDDLCNLAFQGAKVMHPQAVEIAMQYNIPMRIRDLKMRQSYVDPEYEDLNGDCGADRVDAQEIEDDFCGTEVSHIQTGRTVTGIAHRSGLTQIKLTVDQNNMESSLKVFQSMAAHNLSVDFISVTPGEIKYTVPREFSDKACDLLREMDLTPVRQDGCAKVSVVGAGITGTPGIMAQVIQALTSNKIPILQSSDSYTTIWVLVKEEQMQHAIRALHQEFIE